MQASRVGPAREPTLLVVVVKSTVVQSTLDMQGGVGEMLYPESFSTSFNAGWLPGRDLPAVLRPPGAGLAQHRPAEGAVREEPGHLERKGSTVLI